MVDVYLDARGSKLFEEHPARSLSPSPVARQLRGEVGQTTIGPSRHPSGVIGSNDALYGTASVEL